MAERKSGPVKPPVIDLKAKPTASRARSAAAKAETAPEPEAPAEAAAPEAVQPEPVAEAPAEPVVETAPEPEATVQAPAEPAREEMQRPLPPRPPARLAMPWSAISIAAAIGAVLGTGLTYLLVNWLPLADHRPVLTDPTPRLEALESGLDQVRSGTSELASRIEAAEGQASGLKSALDSGLGDLREQVAAIPQTPAVDLTPLRTELDRLEDRVTAIGAGASSADAAALAETISGIESGLAELRTQLSTVEQRVGTTEGTLSALSSDVQTAKAAISAQNQTLGGAEIGPAVRLPLVVSGLESAIGNGRPYQAELENLRTLLPDLAVPEPINSAAATGLPRPDAVATRFAAAVPDILAGRTTQGSGDWGRDALDWMKALLVLRPANEIEGDTPEAVMSRLEGAVSRRDFGAAASLLGQLPAPMQQAAGDVGADIVALAQAESFVAELRARALTPTEAAP